MWDESLPFFGKVKNFGVLGIGACADFAYVGQAFGDIGIGGTPYGVINKIFPKFFGCASVGSFSEGPKTFHFS